jgi:hypothetical protein
MAKGNAAVPVKNTSGESRKSGKATKKHPKTFDPIKRRLVAGK